MSSHKISPYRLKLRQGHEKGKKGKVRDKDLWDLTDLPAMNGGLTKFDTILDLLVAYFEHLREEGFKDDDMKRTLTATDWEPDEVDLSPDPEDRTIEAEFSYGEYNRVADHTAAETFDRLGVSPEQEREEAMRDRGTVAETRLHFMAHIPSGSKQTCFLTVHSYGRGSYKRRFEKSLNEFIRTHYSESKATFSQKADRRKKNYVMKINTVAGQDVVEELSDATIVGFEVQKRDTNVPEYMQSGTELSGDSEGSIKLEYTADDIVSDFGTQKDKLLEWVQNKKYPLAELVDGEPSRANAIVKASGDNTRKINMTREEVRMEKQVPGGALEFDETNRVTPASIGSEARRFLNEKLQELNNDTLREESLLA